MQAQIITIGDEILIGQIVDTNAAYISRALNSAGVVVTERLSIGDDRQRIIEALDTSLAQCDLVIMTGGLGPTKDDITKRTLAEYFGMTLVRNEAVYEHVRAMLTARGIEFNKLNQSQADVPDRCTVLHNAHGTAPAMWFEREGKVVVSLPGVPFEMEHLMQEEVLPRLRAQFALKQVVHRTMITTGLAESMLAKRIEAWEDALPEYIKLAYLPSPSQVRLRLSAYEVDGREVGDEIDRRFEELEELIPQYVVGYEHESIFTYVHNLLINKGLTLAVAESCTGGVIASRFTAQAGASSYFLCGVVSYSNEAKAQVLGVNMADIERYGAVSQAVAEQMAEGARRISGADYAVATTGIAGPTGGSEEKPVGTVWFAVATPNGVRSERRVLGTVRSQVIERASGVAATLLRDAIIDQKGE